MRQSDVMVYLMTGFLDSGKTQFLTFTLEQDYFQIQGKTLLILCEEGEEEYDPKEIDVYKRQGCIRVQESSLRDIRSMCRLQNSEKTQALVWE